MALQKLVLYKAYQRRLACSLHSYVTHGQNTLSSLKTVLRSTIAITRISLMLVLCEVPLMSAQSIFFQVENRWSMEGLSFAHYCCPDDTINGYSIYFRGLGSGPLSINPCGLVVKGIWKTYKGKTLSKPEKLHQFNKLILNQSS